MRQDQPAINLLQVRRAYQIWYGETIPNGTSYQAAFAILVTDLGRDRAIRFCLSMNPRADAPELPLA